MECSCTHRRERSYSLVILMFRQGSFLHNPPLLFPKNKNLLYSRQHRSLFISASVKYWYLSRISTGVSMYSILVFLFNATKIAVTRSLNDFLLYPFQDYKDLKSGASSDSPTPALTSDLRPPISSINQ